MKANVNEKPNSPSCPNLKTLHLKVFYKKNVHLTYVQLLYMFE